jgi:hypothetical protein
MSLTIHNKSSVCPFENTTNAIYESLQPGSLNQSAAEEALRDLHDKGVSLAKELRLKVTPHIPNNLNGILHTLTQIQVAHFQGNHPLKCVFAKTVHVLAEIAFWQMDATGRPMQETAESVKRVATQLLEATAHPPYMRPSDRVPVSAVVTRFHANSLLQLSRCLTESPAALSCFMTGAQLVTPVPTGDAGTALGNLATTVTQAADHWVNSWLMQTLELRWNALIVDNPDQFDQFILPYIERYTQQGQEHTVCLAIVLMDLIVDDSRTQDVRSQAVLMLLNLTELTSRGFKDKITYLPAEVTSHIAGHSDRFDTTRQLVRAFLSALSIAPEFQEIVHQKLVTSAGTAQAANSREELQRLTAVIEGIDRAMQSAAQPYDQVVNPYEVMRAQLQRSALRGADHHVTEAEIQHLEQEIQNEKMRITPLVEECTITVQKEFDKQWQALQALLAPNEPTPEGTAL